MKVSRFAVMVSALMVGLFLVNTSWASPVVFKVKVPFSFFAAEKQLPAGEYLLTQGQGGHSMTLRQADGPEYATVLVMPRDKGRLAQGDTLSFHRYGSEYFLQSVSVQGPVGGDLVRSKRERNMALEMAQKNGQGSMAQVILTGGAEE